MSLIFDLYYRIKGYFSGAEYSKDYSNITIGCWVYPNGRYFSGYLEQGWPKKVTKITDGPDYAGGKFVYCGDEGYYINGLKRCP